MRDAIRERLASAYGSVEVVRRLHDVPPHEVYEVTVDRRRAVCKIDSGPTGNAAIEGRVMAFVGDRTDVPVPAVLAVGEDYYLAEWHPEAPNPDAEPATTETWATAAGRGLATLHEETGAANEEYGEFRWRGDGLQVGGHARWHDAAVAYVGRHRDTLDRFGHADVADTVRDFLLDHPEVFDGAGSPVCCHGWWSPEHVSVRDGTVACVVDFEHAIAAPPAFDYWRTVVPTFEEDEESERRSFRKGYESVRPLPADLASRRPAYHLLNDVYYLVSLYVQSKHGPSETADRAEWLRDHVHETIDRLS